MRYCPSLSLSGLGSLRFAVCAAACLKATWVFIVSLVGRFSLGSLAFMVVCVFSCSMFLNCSYMLVIWGRISTHRTLSGEFKGRP